VGSHVARRLVNWDVRLIACDPYVSDERARSLGATLVDLPTLLAESDVVSLHASLTDETRLLIGEKALRAMKPGAILINTARGALVDEAALIEALKSGHIRHAGLDVFHDEPLKADHPLAKLPNVTLTSHAAFRTLEASMTLLRRAIDIVKAIS